MTFDLTDGSSRVIVGPATGYPYPPSGTHVSALQGGGLPVQQETILVNRLDHDVAFR